MDPITYGYVISGAAFATLCISPILGRVADVMGSRTVFILCMMSASAAHFTMAIATNVTMLIVSRAFGLLMDCTLGKEFSNNSARILVVKVRSTSAVWSSSILIKAQQLKN